MNVKNVVGTIAAVGFVGLAGLIYTIAPGREINPIGWGDMTGDGVNDALLVNQPNGLTSRFYTLGFIDGNEVQQDEEGTFRTKAPFEYFLIERGRTELRNFSARRGVTYAATVNRLGKKPSDCVNFTLYTSVDEEAGSHEEPFPCINRDVRR